MRTICLRHTVMNFNCLTVTLVLRNRKHLITIVCIEFHTQFNTAGISRIYSLSCGHDSHPTVFKYAYCYLRIPDKVSCFRVRSDRSVSTDQPWHPRFPDTFQFWTKILKFRLAKKVTFQYLSMDPKVKISNTLSLLAVIHVRCSCGRKLCESLQTSCWSVLMYKRG